MNIREGRFSVTHTINMGNYESVKFEHSVLFDMEGDQGTVESAFAAARSHIDTALATDLGRAAQCTALPDEQTYVHSWIEEING